MKQHSHKLSELILLLPFIVLFAITAYYYYTNYPDHTSLKEILNSEMIFLSFILLLSLLYILFIKNIFSKMSRENKMLQNILMHLQNNPIHKKNIISKRYS